MMMMIVMMMMRMMKAATINVLALSQVCEINRLSTCMQIKIDKEHMQHTHRHPYAYLDIQTYIHRYT